MSSVRSFLLPKVQAPASLPHPHRREALHMQVLQEELHAAREPQPTYTHPYRGEAFLVQHMRQGLSSEQQPHAAHAGSPEASGTEIERAKLEAHNAPHGPGNGCCSPSYSTWPSGHEFGASGHESRASEYRPRTAGHGSNNGPGNQPDGIRSSRLPGSVSGNATSKAAAQLAFSNVQPDADVQSDANASEAHASQRQQQQHCRRPWRDGDGRTHTFEHGRYGSHNDGYGRRRRCGP
mmetsp:Transcript_18512/g.29518  ORF Transcript_18512/g.29518 Transcript_18512/m.29518 type:complete len:236 (+) Transcript_18512:342-1049(+)